MKRTTAPGNVNNLYTEGNPPATPATVVGAAEMNALQEEVANAVEGAGIVLDENDDTQLLQAIRAIGGGGGGSAVWADDNVDAPIKDFENFVPVYLFEDGQSQALYLALKLSKNFSAGPQIRMALGSYSPSTGQGYVLRTTTTLIRNGTDAMSATTNQHVSSDSISNGSPSNRLNQSEHNLTDSNGQINSISPSGGDILIVKLDRNVSDGNDTDTGSVRFLPNTTEVFFA